MQYEICAYPETVDLLVTLAYQAAIGSSLEQSLPIGMGLRVPVHGQPELGLQDFDALDSTQVRHSWSSLLP